MTKKKETEAPSLDISDLDAASTEVVSANDYTPPETFDDAVSYFIDRDKQDVRTCMRSAWELGGTIKALMDEGRYGDNTVEAFCEKTGFSASYCYECKAMFEVYSWEIIQTRFIETRVKPYTLMRIASTKDTVVRAQLENRLLAGELPPTKIGEIKKQIEAQVHPDGAGGDDEAKGAKGKKEPKTGPKDPATQTVTSSNTVRGIFGDIEQTCKNLEFMLERVDNGLDLLDDISDETVRDSTLLYVSSCYEQATQLQTRLNPVCAKMKKYVI